MKQFKLHHTIVFWRKMKYICVVLKKTNLSKTNSGTKPFFLSGASSV